MAPLRSFNHFLPRLTRDSFLHYAVRQTLLLYLATATKRASEASADKKKHKMKNDPCQKSLPPGVNRFVEKGPLKPEKNKRASEASDKKVMK